jgi:hypothetical protein
MLFNPLSVKAQSVSQKCEWVWKWVWVWENEYNGATSRTELQYVYRYRYVYDCGLAVTAPTVTETSAKDQDRTNPTSETKQPTRPGTAPEAKGSSTKLKLGIYRASAQESGPVCYGSHPIKTTATLNIKIESIDRDGNVRATAISPGKGTLKGKIDDNGNLQLEGFIISKSIIAQSEYKLSLKATVEDDTLTNGKYIRTGTCNEIKGKFNRAIWEEDF